MKESRKIRHSRRIMMLLLAILMILPFTTTVNASKKEAEKPFSIILDWKPLNIDDISGFPYINNNRTMVPIRVISEGMGYNVTWNQQGTVQISSGSKTIYLKTGSNIAVVNGSQVNLDSKVEVKDNRMMVPIRFISESFGASVKYQYNPSAHIILISTK